MGIGHIVRCWICMLSIGFCSGMPQQLLMSRIDEHKKLVLLGPCQFTQLYEEDITLPPSEDINKLQQKLGAQKVTAGKIFLESIGAAAGGFACAYVISSISPVLDDFDTGWITFPTSIAVGTALGATLVGNQLMDPNGSFIGSLGLSSLGTAIACPLAFLALLSMDIEYGSDDPSVGITFLVLAAALPVTGAVQGYNLKYMGCCSSPVPTEFDSDLHRRMNSSAFSCKVQLFALHL